MEDKLLPESSLKIVIPQGKCKVCKIKAAKVLYFDIPVCSGCRAFFIRSMKSNKNYYCLNGRLCGRNNELVPTRRICKKCRFDRCVKAGMLDAKVKLQNHLENIKHAKQHQIDSQLKLMPKHFVTKAQVENSRDVLTLFLRFRQKYIHGLHQMYGQSEIHECTNGPLKNNVVFKNFQMFSHAIESTKNEEINLFSRFDSGDLKTLTVIEYNVWLTTIEQILLTTQNFGHKLKRLYSLDNSFSNLNRDYFYNKWSYLLPIIQQTMGDKTQEAYDILIDYMFVYNTKMVNKLAISIGNANLDDQEIAALILLLMSREAYVQIVKTQETRQYLKWLKNHTLNSLAKHIESTGGNVNERMAKIIFMTSEFLEIGHLIRKYMRLFAVSTNKMPLSDGCKTNFELFLKANAEFVYF